MLISIEEPSPESTAPQWQAFLELGFRPLYLLGCGWAAITIFLWVYFPQVLGGPLGGVLWHAHEMLWGFIITIAVGFLLTAGATWTGITPLKGPALGAACLLWLVARLCYLLPSDIAFWIAATCETLFFTWAALALAYAIYRSRSRRNYGIPPLILLLSISNLLFLLAAWDGEYERIMAHFQAAMLGMAVIALLVARRVTPFFAMRATPGLKIPMQVKSGQWQVAAGVAAIVCGLLQWTILSAITLALAGLIALWQLLSWKPWRIRAQPLLWVLYAGYFGLGVGLLVAATQRSGLTAHPVWAVHIIGIAGFSVLIIGMVTRTALGHLGRALQTDRSMVCSYILVLVAAALRLMALAVQPPLTIPFLHTAALAWILAFALYLWRFVPMLIRPRIRAVPGRRPIIHPKVIARN